MSTTLIFAVKQGEEPIFIGETSNAWRGAMYVWNDIAKRYFGLEGFPGFDAKMHSRIWNAGNEKPLTEAELIVLASTMDKAVVAKPCLDKLLDAFKEYGARHERSSISEQAELISVNVGNIPDGYAIAWNQTSVNGDMWFIEWDDEGETGTCNITDAFDVIEQVCEAA